MPAALLLMAVAVVGAALAAVAGVRTQLADSARRRPLPARVDRRRQVYSSVLQRFVVTPNEQVRETPFIEHNIDATRRAFGLDGVEERPMSGDALLTRATSTATPRRSRTSGSGITSRCSRRSGRSRRSAPTTTSCRSTTTATRSTARCGR